MEQFDTGVPHPARIYDALLGGNDNFAADRAVADQMRSNPAATVAPLANRDFLRRAVRHLAEDAGVDQFLDLGSGLPTSPNVHEVALGAHPAARVVYVDNDPIVAAQSRASLTGAVDYLEADARDSGPILAHASQVLDLSRPVALLMVALAHFLDDADEPYALVGTLMDALPPGSYLAMSHLTGDFQPEETRKAEMLYRSQGMVLRARTREEFARFFDGLELVEPGVELIHRWRPDALDRVSPDTPGELAPGWSAVGRKP